MKRFLPLRIQACFALPLLGLLLLAGLRIPAWSDAYADGLRLYSQGNYAMAVRYFLESINQSADNVNAHYYLADSYMKLNRLAEAQAEYQKIIAIGPDTQAGRFSKVALSQLSVYRSMRANGQWRRSGSTGRIADFYNGPAPDGDDYLDRITEGGRLVRWSLRKMPVTLYIEESPKGIRNFQPGFVAQVRKAMDIWVGVLNHQLSYQVVTQPEKADIRVYWINTIDTRGHNGDGGTAYTAGLMIPHLRGNQIESMEVKLSTFDIRGNPQSSQLIYAVAIHELGHSLGLLGHSDNPADIMYAENQHVITPSRRDSNTLRRLYSQKADISNATDDLRTQDAERQQELSDKLDETIRRLEQQAKQGDMSLSWLNLGVAYFQKGKHLAVSTPQAARLWYDKALQATSRTIQLEPMDARAYHKRSLVYQELNDYPNALKDIQKAVSIDSGEPEYYMLQAWFFANVGEKAQARNALDVYLRMKPGAAGSDDVRQIREKLTPRK